MLDPKIKSRSFHKHLVTQKLHQSFTRNITENSFFFASQIFRKYKVKYNYGPMNYRVSPTYIPDKPLKFQLIERDS